MLQVMVRSHEGTVLQDRPAGPPGTGKSHVLIAPGHAAISDGRRVRYLTAADLVEKLFAGLADNLLWQVNRNRA